MSAIFNISISTRPLIDMMAPEQLEMATFASRDVYDTEARLGFTRGVWCTSVGYAETRRGLTHAVKIYYSPETVSYAQLLELILGWYGADTNECESRESSESHDACDAHNDAGIFFQTEQERRLACAAVNRSSFYDDGRSPMFVRPFKAFHRAENAAQKYYLHLAEWFYEKLLTLYRTEEDLLSSTLAARLNGFLRCPSVSALCCMPESAELYGLSANDLSALKEILT